METMRAFIAIELPAGLNQQLARLQTKLKADNRLQIKWVNPEGIHLTLKFLGNIPVSDTDRITQAMADAASQITPFYLEIEGLGAFPNLKRVQVIWVGLGGETERLNRLQRLVENNLAQLGFATEQRHFKAHLTLARLGREVPPMERRRLGEIIAGTRFEVSEQIKVGSINLIRSRLTREGAIYSCISSAALLKEI